MARTQINPIAAPTVTPQARPVGHFERTDAGAQLGQLADALKGLAPELAQYGNTVFQQNRDEDVKAGTAKANEVYQEIVTTGQQIKAGEIAPHESKWYRAAASEQLGRLTSAKFGSTLKAAMEDPNSPLAQSTDPTEFDTFAEQARKDFLAQGVAGDDAFFNAAFNEGANKEVLAARDTFASQAGTRLQTQVIEATYQEHQQTIELGLQQGLTMEQIGQEIYRRNTIQYALNPSSGAALANTMRKAVLDTARKTENLEVLDILKHIPGGAKGSTLANTSQANKEVPEAEREIRAARQQRYALANTEDSNATEQAIEGALGGLYDSLDAASDAGLSLTSVDPKKFADMVSAVDPTQVSRVYRAFDQYKKRTEVDDEVIAKGLWNQANRFTLTYDAVADAYENGDLTVETSRKLRTEIRNNNRKKGAAKALTQNPLMTETKTRLRGLFIDQYGINAPEMRMRAELAVQDLEDAWVQWRRGEGSAADDAMQSEWLQKQTLSIFSAKADVDLKEATAAVLPPKGSFNPGPQPVQWEKGLVTKPMFLQGLGAHLDNLRKIPNYRLPAAYEELLRRNGIKNAAEADAFLKKQQSFIPRQ